MRIHALVLGCLATVALAQPNSDPFSRFFKGFEAVDVLYYPPYASREVYRVGNDPKHDYEKDLRTAFNSDQEVGQIACAAIVLAKAHARATFPRHGELQATMRKVCVDFQPSAAILEVTREKFFGPAQTGPTTARSMDPWARFFEGYQRDENMFYPPDAARDVYRKGTDSSRDYRKDLQKAFLLDSELAQIVCAAIQVSDLKATATFPRHAELQGTLREVCRKYTPRPEILAAVRHRVFPSGKTTGSRSVVASERKFSAEEVSRLWPRYRIYLPPPASAEEWQQGKSKRSFKGDLDILFKKDLALAATICQWAEVPGTTETTEEPWAQMRRDLLAACGGLSETRLAEIDRANRREKALLWLYGHFNLYLDEAAGLSEEARKKELDRVLSTIAQSPQGQKRFLTALRAIAIRPQDYRATALGLTYLLEAQYAIPGANPEEVRYFFEEMYPKRAKAGADAIQWRRGWRDYLFLSRQYRKARDVARQIVSSETAQSRDQVYLAALERLSGNSAPLEALMAYCPEPDLEYLAESPKPVRPEQYCQDVVAAVTSRAIEVAGGAADASSLRQLLAENYRVRTPVSLASNPVGAGGTWARLIPMSPSAQSVAMTLARDGGLLLAAQSGGIVIIRVRPNGEVEWSRKYGTANDGYPTRIVATKDDGVLIVGHLYGPSPVRSVGVTTGFAMKVSIKGNVEWQWQIDLPATGTDSADLVDAAEGHDGFLLVGSAAEDVSLVMKVNPLGGIQWQKTFNVAGFDLMNSVSATPDGGWILGGQTRNAPWLLKLTYAGEIEWQKNYRASRGSIQKVRPTPDNGFIVAANDDREIRVLKVRADGMPQWDRLLTAPGSEFVSGLEVLTDGSFLIAGETTSAGAGSDDVFVAKLSSTGQLMWQKAYGGAENDSDISHPSFVATRDGFVAASESRSFGDSRDLLLLKGNPRGEVTDCQITGDYALAARELKPAIAEVRVTESKVTVKTAARSLTRSNLQLFSRDICAQIAQQSPSRIVRAAPVEPPPTAGTEFLEGRQVQARAKELLSQKRFDELDRQAAEFRRSRFRSGESKLSVLYSGLAPDLAQSTEKTRADTIRTFQEWIRLRPESLTARIALANAYLSFAGEERSSSLAKDVTAEGWKEFNALVERAEQILRDAESLPLDDPEYFEALLRIGTWQSWDEPTMWAVFDRGFALDPRHLLGTRLFSLLPRWGGAQGALEQFASKIAERTKKTYGDALYALIALWAFAYAQEDEYIKEPYSSYGFSWPRTKKGFRDLERLFPGSNANQHLMLSRACWMKDRELVAEILGRPNLLWDADAARFWNSRNEFEQCRAWSAQGTQQRTARIPDRPQAEGALGHYTSGWPQLILRNRLTFSDGSSWTGGFAFIVRDDRGRLAAVTSYSALPAEKVRSPKELRATIREWELVGPKGAAIQLQELLAGGPADQRPGSNTTGLMYALMPKAKPPIRVLPIRSTPVALSETLYVPRCTAVADECNQAVHAVEVRAKSIGTGSAYGSLTLEIKDQVEPREFLGSVVVDDRGFAAGVIIDGNTFPSVVHLTAEEIGRILESPATP